MDRKTLNQLHLLDLELEFSILMFLLKEAIKRKQKKQKKRLWVAPFRRLRTEYSVPQILLPHLSEEEYRQYFRVNRSQFNDIHNLIKDDIRKKHTFFRETIGTRERLAVTLRFLASGHSLRALSFEFRMGESTISKIVRDVCSSIWNRMQPTYMPVPTKEMWVKILNEFQHKWHFPNCLGAIDGKHVSIRKPIKSGSEYYCYKQHFSIVLMAVADADYKFIFIDVGFQGRFSDGYSFMHSTFGENLRANKLDLPDNKTLSDYQSPPLPYVFVADAAFPLQEHIMRPFPKTYTKDTMEPRVFNYRLSRARQTIECTFGILAARFRVYSRPMEVKVNTANIIVKATCILHNYLRENISHEENIEVAPECDLEDQPSNQLIPLSANRNRTSKLAFNIREEFSKYFNGSGSVSWQIEAVRKGKY